MKFIACNVAEVERDYNIARNNFRGGHDEIQPLRAIVHRVPRPLLRSFIEHRRNGRELEPNGFSNQL